MDTIVESEKLLQINSPKARTLKGLSLHHHDLKTSLQLLEALNSKTLSSEVRKGLWYHAITIFYKCFKHSDARRRLWPQIVLSKRPDLLPIYSFFMDLRDRHIVHDDNPYIRAYVGVRVKKETDQYTVEEVISNIAVLDILDENKWRIFCELVRYAVEWVDKERIRLQNALRKECEEMSCEELDALEELVIIVPTLDQVSSKKENEV